MIDGNEQLWLHLQDDNHVVYRIVIRTTKQNSTLKNVEYV